MRTAMWIAGAELRGDGSPEVVRNPATEEALADVPTASPDQVARAERKPWWYPYGQQG